ncbi:MAG: triose-phosphate isomerase [Acidimicrobiales bacterium]|nr:triose-phosphate isomerase [Acidimicrobiales bacterium]
MRKPLISGNWKMHLNHFEAMKLIQEMSYKITGDDVDVVDVSVHPPFTDLRTVQTVIDSDKLPFFLGAQHCHYEEKGAFTGEIAPSMLAKLNVTYVITGHSERREVFGETDEMVNLKTKAILATGMTPIVCVGETLQERDAGDAEAKIGSQVQAALTGLSAEQVGSLVIAYEPIWAIGTGRTASAEDAQAMCHHVRAGVQGIYGDEAAQSVRIQYGGSVKPANARELLTQPDIDGALVGGASLDADDFSRIVQYRLAD